MFPVYDLLKLRFTPVRSSKFKNLRSRRKIIPLSISHEERYFSTKVVRRQIDARLPNSSDLPANSPR